MRIFSSAALQAMNAQETGQAFLVLETISHQNLLSPIAITSDAVATVSNGVTFVPFPFLFSTPDDRSDQLPTAALTVDNIDLSIIAALRAAGNVPPTVLMQVAMAATPNTIEAQWTMTMRNVNYDEMTIAMDLRFDEILDEPYPGDQVTPATMPGVFAIEE